VALAAIAVLFVVQAVVRLASHLAPDVAWHDPSPPPHGGELRGVEAVLRDVFDQAGRLTGGSTRLWLEDLMANDKRAVALVGWRTSLRGETMEGWELALYSIRRGKICEARFFPFDPAAYDAFFARGD